MLATESTNPSGMGAHMLILCGGLRDRYDITLAAPFGDGMLVKNAAALGLAVKAFESVCDFGCWLQTNRPDLLHIHAGIGWEAHALAHLGKAADIPVIRTEHLPFLLTDETQISEFRAGLSAVARLIVVSDASRATFMDAGIDTEKISVIRNGILPMNGGEPARAQWGPPFARTLISIARFSPQKDHATLVQAMPTVLADCPDAVLLLVGDGPEMLAVKNLVADLAIGNAVRFAGQRDDVASLLASADLFVSASRFEGLPLAVLEAMSVGIPVVATAIGGTIEALGDDYPYLVEPGRPQALGEAICAVLKDPIAGARAGEAERARFEQLFSAARMVAETEEIYRATLNTGMGKEREDRTMGPTRIGFVGAGGIAQRHLDILGGFEDVQLVAFSDPDFERANQTALRFGAQAFPGHQEMLSSQEIDAAYICIPPFAHGQVERDLIALQIPFFVEKPITLDLKLARELADEIAGSGLITAVGYHWRYLDIVEEARSRLRDNPAQLVSGYWLDQTPPPHWWWKKDTSGGQIVEQATHIIDLARYLVGDVTRVFGQTAHRKRADFPDLDVATSSTASLAFASGAIGNIASTCALRWGHHIGLNLFADGLAIELTDRDIMVDVGEGRPVRRAEGDPVWLEDRTFIDAIRGADNRIRCSYQEALSTHRIALAIARSADGGVPIDLDTF